SNMDSGMFYAIQKGAIEALKSGKDWFSDLNKMYSKRRELVYQLADKLGCTYDAKSVGLFVWAKIPKEEKSAENFVNTLLREKDLFVVPGTIFGTNGENYIRFSLCVSEEKIKEILNKI
ncbi:MAG: aminotransferase class I/II-fold pyridoxal phosphate-dependent enzyme, partial [Ignavibacteria bacterium]|nr:aminotransferase class I/II-fold pyridoxal phosphate-dependent enzyme [Ignavibacteria bacterium]